MKLTFTTPCAFDSHALAASFGFAGAPDPEAKTIRTSDIEPEGVLLTGTYEEILSALDGTPNQAGIVVLGNCGGENDFIRALQAKAGCPLTGGAAAIDPVTGRSGLIAGGGQAAVFLIRDPRYRVEVVSENIHTTLLGTHHIEFDEGRLFKTIDGQDALTWYNARRAELGIPLGDFEHLTFSDPQGVNAHTFLRDGRLAAGRDLCDTMILRLVKPEQVYPRMAAFYSDPTALVFGCAGLKGILPQPIPGGGTGLFMFGEVCTVAGVSQFGNLMLSKLILSPA